MLAACLRDSDRAFFLARFGWDGNPPRAWEQLLPEFHLTTSQATKTTKRCLTTLAIRARSQPLPGIRQMLGPDCKAWATNAWNHLEHSPHRGLRVSCARMLLVIGGIPYEETYWLLRDLLADAGLVNNSSRDEVLRRRRERVEQRAHVRAERVVSKLLAHTIWPTTARPVDDLQGYRRMRTLGASSSAQAGYFYSRKRQTFVQYESGLEHLVLSALDLDGRVVSYQEQPIQLPVQIHGRPLRYTPDAIAHLDDGRVILMEIKPPAHLSAFDDWIRWTALSRWCEQTGAGLFIGGPRTSILEHYAAAQFARMAEPVADLVRRGPIRKSAYRELRHKHGASMIEIGHAVTALALHWQPAPFQISVPTEAARVEARRFWALAANRLGPPNGE